MDEGVCAYSLVHIWQSMQDRSKHYPRVSPTCMYEDLDDRGGGGWAELGEYVADAGYMHCWHSGGFVLPPVAYINIQHVVVID